MTLTPARCAVRSAIGQPFAGASCWLRGAVAASVLATAGAARAEPTPASSPKAEAPTPSPPPAPNAKREPTAGDLATARTALREGLALRERGDLQAALARLASAYDLVPTPVTGFELGKTHMMLGHVLQAHELFKKVVRMPASLEESTRSQTSRDEAARLAKELEPRIPSLRLKLQLPDGASAVVSIDDDVVTTTGAETIRAVDPGPHDIVAKAGDGPEQKVHVEVAEAETKEVALSPQWIAPKLPTAAGGKQVIFVRQTNPLAFVGFGVAAAALVVTVVGGIVYFDARDEARAQCGNEYCPPAQSRGSILAANAVVDRAFDDMNTKAGVAAVITVAGALTSVVFVGVGALGVMRPIKEKVVARDVRPMLGPTGVGVVGTF